MTWSLEQIARVLHRAGFEVRRRGAKHDIYYKDGWPYPVVVPRHRGDLRPGTARQILRQAGLTTEEAEKLK